MSLKDNLRFARQLKILEEQAIQKNPKLAKIGAKEFPNALREIFTEYQKADEDLSVGARSVFSDDPEFEC